MDQNDVLPTQPNIHSGYEYAADATDLSSLTANFDYSGKTVPEFTSTEPIVTTTASVQSSSMTGTCQYTPDYMTPSNYYNNGTYPYEHINQDNVDPNEKPSYEDLNSVVDTNVDSYVSNKPIDLYSPTTLESSSIEHQVHCESTSSCPVDANNHANSMEVSEEEVHTMQQNAIPQLQDNHLMQLADVPAMQHQDAHIVQQQNDQLIHTDVQILQPDVSSMHQDVLSEMNDHDESTENGNRADSSRDMVIDESADLSGNTKEVQPATSIIVDADAQSSVGQVVPSKADIRMQGIEPDFTTDRNVITATQLDTPVAHETKEREEETESTNHQNGEVFVVQDEIPAIQMCIRKGCINPAVNNPEWEQEFCSNDCVVIHCKNVFMAWVKANEVLSQ